MTRWALLVVLGWPAAANADGYGARAVVSGDAAGEPVSASDHRVRTGDYVHVPRSDAQSYLTLSPGVLLTNHGGVGHSASMYLRGFDAGEGQGMELSVEGVPLNESGNHHGHGYADTAFLLPEVVREVRIAQGPFDPAQGDFAIAGSAEYGLGLAQPGFRSALSYGSFDRSRLFVGVRPSGEGARTFAAAALTRGDGFGVNRAFAQAHALGQYQAQPWAGTELRTLVFASVQRFSSAGVLRADDVALRRVPACGRSADAQFFCTRDPNQGGSGQRAGLSSVLTRRRGGGLVRLQLYGTGRVFETRENFTGFMSDTNLDGSQRGDLRAGRTDAVVVGARGLVRRPFTALGRRHVGELGVAARHDAVASGMERVRAELDVPYATDFDRRIRETQLNLHARTDLSLHERVRLSVGGRADVFGYRVTDLNQPRTDRLGARLGHERFEAYGFALSPRATLDVEAWSGTHAFVSVGGGARSSDPTALSQAEAAPFARVWSGEVGLSAQQSVGPLAGELRLAAYGTRVSSDFLFEPEVGRNQPVGPSGRLGAHALLAAELAGYGRAQVSGAYAHATLLRDGAPLLSLTSGERMPYIPAWLVRADLSAERLVLPRYGLSVFGGFGLSYVGERPLPEANWARPYTLVDAALGAATRYVDLSLRVTNLVDARVRPVELFYASSFDPEGPRSLSKSRHFAAGAPREWLVTLSFHLLMEEPS
jgi:iron complex outermembrane recepter protein